MNTDDDGNSVWVSYDRAMNNTENHAAACKAMLNKMNWTGRYIGGHIKSGMVWVCQHDSVPFVE